MLGAILGDIIGSPYEKNNAKSLNTNDFPLFCKNSRFTDDTVMTIAIGDAILAGHEKSSDETIRENVIKSMQKWGAKYPNAGYGRKFKQWLESKQPQPYGSWGNGSAMRVSPVGWLFSSLERTLEVAKITAEVTHNHIDAINGAQAVAAAIFIARKGANKNEIKDFIMMNFGYELNRNFDDILQHTVYDLTCKATVQNAFFALLNSENFEQAIRKAVSIGGDTDTLAAICGSIAEPLFGIPDELIKEAEKRITQDFRTVLCNFFVERYGDISNISQEWIFSNFISELEPNNIWACAGAAGGAMGDPGSINIIYTDEKNKIHHFGANWLKAGFDLDLLAKRFEPINTPYKSSKGWTFIYLGCGNSLLVKDALYKIIAPYIKKIPDYEMYNKWLPLCVKVLIRMGYSLYFHDDAEIKRSQELQEFMSPVQKQLWDQRYSEGLSTGIHRGKNHIIEAASDFLKENGLTPEFISIFRNHLKNF